jgi:thiol-disulfide isomerase/thioredoxin
MKRIYLIIIPLLLTFSCGHSHKSNTETVVPEKIQTDNYAILWETPVAPRIAEDLSGKVIVLYEKDFIERITAIDNPKGFQYLGQTPCIVEFYTDWCKPCGYQSELMNRMAPDYKGRVIFYKINIDKAYYVKNAFKVETIPMIIFFKPRGEIITSIGYLNKEKLTQMIADHLLNF